MLKPKRYFVSYNFYQNNSFRFGNGIVERETIINSEEDIKEIQNFLTKELSDQLKEKNPNWTSRHHVSLLHLINWILLK